MGDSFRGPLRVGALVRIDTSAPLDADSVIEQVCSAQDTVVPLSG